jgi:DNA-directed RNA polymerase specialized sigma24 family protein
MRGAAGNGHAASRAQEGRGMRGEQDGGKIGQAYQDHRPYLVDLAFRMLGDIGAAEDIV